TMIARPVFAMSTTRDQTRSLTRAVILPMNTPGDISISQRVRCPLSPTGHAVTTMTVIRRMPPTRDIAAIFIPQHDEVVDVVGAVLPGLVISRQQFVNVAHASLQELPVLHGIPDCPARVSR